MTKWSDCHETKNERTYWTLCMRCSSQLWHCSWTWPLIFKVKFLNSCISGMAGLIDLKPKGTKSIGCRANTLTSTFDHTHGIEYVFSRSHFEMSVSQEWDIRLTLNKRDVSRVIQTFGWPRWGVRICQIVTTMTSDVGVPSTRLV